MQFRKCLHQVWWCAIYTFSMIPNLIFSLLGKMFLYLIHLLHLFCIHLFSRSEIIFTNDENVFIHTWCFHLFLCYSIYMKSRLLTIYQYKNLNQKFPCSSSLFFAFIFFNLLYLFCRKLFSPSEIIFINEHVFLRILVTNLRALCFNIYAIPTMCTPYYQSKLNLVSEICRVKILTFSAWGVTVIF